VNIEELERASHANRGSHVAATDGGTTGNDSPPVVMDNVAPATPFEALVEVVGRPRYDEFDPTVILFLTFPAFFG
ncbi:MAG: V-type ATP synthase subunit I, partial [Halobacteriaceae archaeon]